MKWEKKGLIFNPINKLSWAKHSALQPTPILIHNDTIIRIFIGCRDNDGISRIGFVDVEANDPSVIITYSENPILETGMPGTFDENGVVPSAIIKHDNQFYLYYAGYQLGSKVRFYVFCGLSISDDGLNFKRYQRVPVLDRTDQELLFRVIHSIRYENNVWKCWYGGGDKFENESGKSYPIYDIRYAESSDAIHFPDEPHICIPVKGGDEHRVGRPYVIKHENTYKMFYGVGKKSIGYRMGYAESTDGLSWKRKDDLVGISVDSAHNAWDSQMISYPAVVQTKKSTYMFYNGNNYGYNGFGYAELKEW
jgi:predicted GH43/DUF377 family glycosyl hydrolase